MPDVVGTINYPDAVDTHTTLIGTANNAVTVLNGSLNDSANTVQVVSTDPFPNSGVISIDNEIISYTGKTGTTFTGCIRGFDDTVAASHDNEADVQGRLVSAHIETLQDAIIAMQETATTSERGMMSAADKTKLNGVASGATANDTDSNLKNRANHTGTQTLSTISDAGTAAALNVPVSGDAASGQVVKGNDTRLTNSRTPTAHTHDDRYYTESETDTLLATKQNASSALALGETSSTAYRGDRGKAAYDHSQLTSGNPHNVTKTNVGLGNVSNDAQLKIASNLSDLNSASTARSNLGLGTAAVLNVASSGDASSTQVVKGNDTRLVYSGASVYKSGTNGPQSISSDNLTALTWDSEYWDTDNYHSTSSDTHQFTVPSAGYYRVTATFFTEGISFTSDKNCWTGFTSTMDGRRNEYRWQNVSSSYSRDNFQISTVLYANAAGHTVSVNSYQNTGSSVTLYLLNFIIEKIG